MKTSRVIIAVLCCALCMLSAPPGLRSQEEGGPGGGQSIEEVYKDTKVMFIGEDLYTVSIASRREEPLRRAPAAVTVITGEELKRYRTLTEALSSVPGFFADRNEVKNRIYLRGVPDSFLVLMDGVPFSNETSTKDYPREMDLSLDYLEKIEIIRGPGSALWGADAFSGIINLVPKKGKDVQGTVVSSEVGKREKQEEFCMKILIFGAGVIGTICGYVLAQAGKDITHYVGWLNKVHVERLQDVTKFL